MSYQRADRHEVAQQSGGVFKELQIVYDVRQLATEDLQIVYDIRILAGKSLEFLYDIRQLAAKPLDVVWDIAQTAGKSLQIIYDILAEGVKLVGTHARVALPRGLEYQDVEYTFWLKSPILVNTTVSYRLFSAILKGVKETFRIKSALLRPIQTSFKLKSPLLQNTESTYQIKSSLLQTIKEYRVNVKSKTIPKEEYRNIDKNKVKKLLLLNLVETLNDE